MSAPQGIAPGTTVVEFASKHCAEHGERSAEAISAHVNAIIMASVTQNRALWKVGIGPDGQASLIWLSLPDAVWDRLLHEGIGLVQLMAALGGDS